MSSLVPENGSVLVDYNTNSTNFNSQQEDQSKELDSIPRSSICKENVNQIASDITVGDLNIKNIKKVCTIEENCPNGLRSNDSTRLLDMGMVNVITHNVSEIGNSFDLRETQSCASSDDTRPSFPIIEPPFNNFTPVVLFNGLEVGVNVTTPGILSYAENIVKEKDEFNSPSFNEVYTSDGMPSFPLLLEPQPLNLTKDTKKGDLTSEMPFFDTANEKCMGHNALYNGNSMNSGNGCSVREEGIPSISALDSERCMIVPADTTSTGKSTAYQNESNNCSEHNILEAELENQKTLVMALQANIERVESENVKLTREACHQQCEAELATLQERVLQQAKELELGQQEHDLDTRTIAAIRQDMSSKLETIRKKFEAANREKESMVMRYAVSEKELMELKKDRELSEKKTKEAVKEREVLLGKLKALSGEKSRICTLVDSKCTELGVALKEVENLKEEVNARDIKIKWTQNKLRSEIDALKESQSKLEKVTQKLQEAREEVEQARRAAQESIRDFKESEENKAYTLGQQLKEEQARLIMERHELKTNEEGKRQLTREVEVLRKKQLEFIDENNTLSIKVQNVEQERLECEAKFSRLKQTSDQQSEQVALLQGQLAEMEALRSQLCHETERARVSQCEAERLRLGNIELSQDMAACRDREAEILDFTQKLTTKNVRLQSEFTALEAKAEQLELVRVPLERSVEELTGRVQEVERELRNEREARGEERQLLARHLAEKTAAAERLAAELEEQRGEAQVARHKHATQFRELNRELQQSRKKLEQCESGPGSETLGHGSRTSSTSSLNEAPSAPAHLVVEPDRQSLIERIVRLQRMSAKQVERIDFLEEHSRTLVTELQKKTKLLQGYIMRDQSGALASPAMDHNKAELARHGGIMASIYGSKTIDDTMTLELSIEINSKLQAVLEDTLLKNITLKENIDTLGDEISRLRSEVARMSKDSAKFGQHNKP